MLIACIPLPTIWVTIALPTGGDARSSDGTLELGAMTARGVANLWIFVAAVAAILVSITEPQPRNTSPRVFALEVLL